MTTDQVCADCGFHRGYHADDCDRPVREFTEERERDTDADRAARDIADLLRDDVLEANHPRHYERSTE